MVFAGAAFGVGGLVAVGLTVAAFDAGFVAAFAAAAFTFTEDDLAMGFFAAALLAGFLATALAAVLVDFDFIWDDTLASLAREAKARVLEAARLLA